MGFFDKLFRSSFENWVDSASHEELSDAYEKEISVSLEELYEQNLLNKTGKIYTADSINPLDAYTEFEYRNFDEYEYEGSKYIRFVTNEFTEAFKLSDETVIEKDKVYYLKVEPIKWIVDKNADIVISKDILFAGIQMDKEINNWDPRFESTQMKGYLDAYFYDEIKKKEGYYDKN